MKALLIKDWKLLMSQKQFFLVTIVIVGAFLFTARNPAFVVSYATIMYTVFTISTISYDDYHNGMSFLMTLPVSRTDYVAEKYTFGILMGSGTSAVVMAAAAAVFKVRDTGLSAEELLLSVMTAMLVAVFFLAFTIPVQLKFGAEKGRMALMAVSMLCFVLVMGGAVLAERMGWKAGDLFEKVEEAPLGMVVCAMGAGCVCILLLSAVISLRVLKQREF
ncbi:MAG: ABC-2 transporter permease [Dorea sp.]|nr:ABC-2 transporter permease [Dorea sp.]